MTAQIVFHILYTIALIGGGGYLGYRYGASAQKKAYDLEQKAAGLVKKV